MTAVKETSEQAHRRLNPEAYKTVDEYLTEELGISLQTFCSKETKLLLKKDIRVNLLVMHGPYYPVEEKHLIKAGAELKVLGSRGPDRTKWQPMGWTNIVAFNFFNPQIILRPLTCDLKYFVEALK